MQIICEYCGAIIDTKKSSSNCCPNCGGSFEHNKQLKEGNEQQKEFDKYMLEQERIETEEKRLKLERQKQAFNYQQQSQKTAKAIKFGCFIPIFIFIAFFFLTTFGIISGIVNMQKDVTDTMLNTNSVVDINKGKMFIDGEEKVTVNFNENAVTQRANIVVDKYEIYNYPYSKPQEGFVYVRVHFTITNTYNESVYMPDEIYATYTKDGVEQEAENPTISSSDLNTKLKGGELRSNMSKQGWCYFTVPKDCEFIIHCDNNVDIVVKPENLSKEN